MPAPSAPTSFAVAAKAILHFFEGAVSNRTALKLTWTNNAAGAQHRVEKSTDNATWSLAVIASPDTDEIIVGKLTNNVHWYFRIRSENADGNSSWATLDLVTPALATSGVPPIAPSSLTVDSVSSYLVNLSWTDNSTNEAYFVVEFTSGSGVVRATQLPGMTTSSPLSLSALFGGDVSDQFFTARVKAIGGSAKASGTPPYSSAWSNSVTFKTSAPTIRITSPLAVSVEKGGPVSYTITTVPTATTWTADMDAGTGGEQLPTGLTRADGVISGTVTAALGTYNIVLTVGDGLTTDTQTLVLTVKDPSIILDYQLVSPLRLGVAIQAYVRTRATAIPGPLTWSLPIAPAWLSINESTGALTGTPDEAGDSVVQVLVTNGTRQGNITFGLSVPDFSITSSAEIPAFVGVAFEHILTSSGSADVTYALEDDAPDWLTLAGSKITGTSETPGLIEVDVIATADIFTASQTLRIDVQPGISVADEIVCSLGSLLFEPVVLRPTGYNGVTWHKSNLPPGLDLVSAGESDSVQFVQGTPTTPGRYLSRLAALVDFDFYADDVPRRYHAETVIWVNGGAFLDWIRRNLFLIDLTCYWEARQLTSSYADGGVLRIVRDDALYFVIVLRDREATVEISDIPISEFRFTIRPTEDMDAEPHFEIGGTVGSGSDFTMIVIGGNNVVEIEIENFTSDAIERRFANADPTPGKEPTNLKLSGVAELELKLDDGRRTTFRGLSIEILRDAQQ